ncbi:MAG: Kiwa anti-phage protein KwaB-like domain-containing protein [Syntrophothermus sp.]
MLKKKDFEVSAYEVIDDDLEKIYSFSAFSRTLAFNDIVENQLKSGTSILPLNNFNEIYTSIWAYCIRLKCDNDEYIYSFRKLGPNKVLIDESHQGGRFNKYFKAHFTTDNRLEMIEGETINIDKSIDCIFYNNKYFVFHKSNFEKILELVDAQKCLCGHYPIKELCILQIRLQIVMQQLVIVVLINF